MSHFFDEVNAGVEESYKLTLDRIVEISDETAGLNDEYEKYFNHTANMIIYYASLEKELRSDDFFTSDSFENLDAKINKYIEEIKPENYKTSFLEPEYAVSIFGEDNYKILYPLYNQYRTYKDYAFTHSVFKMEKFNRLFIDVYNCLKETKEYDALLSVIKKFYNDINVDHNVLDLRFRFDKDVNFFKNIIESSDFSDTRSLLKYGVNITENELKIAEFFSTYPQEKIEKLSKTIAGGYIRSFECDNMDLSKKSTVMLYFHIGYERLGQQLVKDLKEAGLDALVQRPSTTSANKQIGHDHRFANATYFDEENSKASIAAMKEGFERSEALLKELSGTMFIDTFGEKPFTPEVKKHTLKLSQEQQGLYGQHMNNVMGIQNKFIPRSDTSFCIVAFPSPEVGENFEKMFEDISEVNMLDSIKWESMQQHMIDLLDKADHVHVKGKGTNRTDIKVQMHQINNPEKETNFLNCGATVNIPVGEVFTSPVLKGTNGVLHIEDTFLKGLRFKELELVFEDGNVTEYSCKNYENEEENKKYVQENLLFPHNSLPLGEFAIGTNTLAYKIAKEYDILNILPILIIEKMGPHFAIGDTCFSRSEEKAVFNPTDNKEVIARENERSALRHEDINKAYTHCHTDITLPYEGIDFITAVAKDGEKFDIIRDGRFVVKGCEELNVPLDEMEK